LVSGAASVAPFFLRKEDYTEPREDFNVMARSLHSSPQTARASGRDDKPRKRDPRETQDPGTDSVPGATEDLREEKKYKSEKV